MFVCLCVCLFVCFLFVDLVWFGLVWFVCLFVCFEPTLFHVDFKRSQLKQPLCTNHSHGCLQTGCPQRGGQKWYFTFGDLPVRFHDCWKVGTHIIVKPSRSAVFFLEEHGDFLTFGTRVDSLFLSMFCRVKTHVYCGSPSSPPNATPKMLSEPVTAACISKLGNQLTRKTQMWVRVKTQNP